MKKLSFLMLSGLILFSQVFRDTTAALPILQTSDHGGKIEAKYDGFSHETVITLKKMRVSCDIAKGLQTKGVCVSVSAALHAPGKQLDYVRHATVQVIFETKNWDQRHPLTERELSVVADGETIRLGTMGLVKQDMGNDRLLDVMKEVLEVSVPYAIFNKIARAELVEMRVGNSEFTLQEKNVAALRDLNNRVKF